MGEFQERMAFEIISTGSIALDLALGVGGFPRGRIVEIYGPESSGKTTLALHAIAEAQKSGGIAAFIDVEHALDPKYAAALGVDLDNLLVSQPDTGEQALEIAEMLTRSNAVDVVVVDSVAALVTKAETRGRHGRRARRPAGASDVAGAAQAHRRDLAQSKTIDDLHQPAAREGRRHVRQSRDDLGRPRAEVLRVDAPRRPQARDRSKSGKTSSVRARASKVVKNKVAPPFRQAEFDITYGAGSRRWARILDVALEQNIVGKSGSWYTYGEQRIGQGRENAKAFLEEHPELAEEIEDKIRALMEKSQPSAADNGSVRYAVVEK